MLVESSDSSEHLLTVRVQFLQLIFNLNSILRTAPLNQTLTKHYQTINPVGVQPDLLLETLYHKKDSIKINPIIPIPFKFISIRFVFQFAKQLYSLKSHTINIDITPMAHLNEWILRCCFLTFSRFVVSWRSRSDMFSTLFI